MKIYIDPGHGGSDPGAIGNGLLEKDLTLDISLRQKDLFERLGNEVKMSRTEDNTVSLESRVQDANRWGADVFISNHINDAGGQGVEVWHSIVGGKSKEYAKGVEEKLRTIFKSRGLKTREGRDGDYLFVIRATNMPAILNEFGFIDNTEDTTKLKRQDIRQKCAEAVVYGLLKIEVENQPSAKIDKPKEEKVNQSTRLLKYTTPMMSGDDVKKVQSKLNALGFNSGNKDGVYGVKTVEAVKRYQRAKGLKVDGIVGEITWNSLMM